LASDHIRTADALQVQLPISRETLNIRRPA